MARHIKTGDTVMVTTGADRGKTGRVLRTEPGRGRVFVEGAAIQKRHQRAAGLGGPQASAGGVIEIEGPIHVSNVMLLDPETGDPTRVGIKREGALRTRVAKKSGTEFD